MNELDKYTDLELEEELLRRRIIHEFGEIPDENLTYFKLLDLKYELENKYYK